MTVNNSAVSLFQPRFLQLLWLALSDADGPAHARCVSEYASDLSFVSETGDDALGECFFDRVPRVLVFLFPACCRDWDPVCRPHVTPFCIFQRRGDELIEIVFGHCK